METGFSHSGRNHPHGQMESNPHNLVHGLVGGSNPNQQLPGLMSAPFSAAYDPIFWLHHANIDRLWESWLQADEHINPQESNWLAGPGSAGERTFVMPGTDGSDWEFLPSEMVDLSTLDYSYDDLSPVVPSLIAVNERLIRLGVPADEIIEASAARRSAMSDDITELLGASDTDIAISGGSAIRAPVQIDAQSRSRLKENFSNARSTQAPDRVFLNLENITSDLDAVILKVYIGMAEGANPVDHRDKLVGSVALFGASQASDPDGEAAGQGLTQVLEITKLVDTLYLADNIDVDQLEISIVPMNPVPDQANVRIGRIGIYRQGK